MTDKEKKIEEMAKVICKKVNDKELKHCEIQCNTDCTGIAEAFYNAGYRKIHEDEWQKYCAYKIIEPQIKGCLDREEALIKELKQTREQAVKEFYEKAKENFDWYCSRYGSLDGEDCEKILDETLKEVIGEKKL